MSIQSLKFMSKVMQMSFIAITAFISITFVFSFVFGDGQIFLHGFEVNYLTNGMSFDYSKLSVIQKVGATVLSGLSLIFLMQAMLTLSSFFKSFTSDIHFTEVVSKKLKTATKFLLLSSVLNLVLQLPLTAYLSILANPPGQRFMSITASGQDVVWVFLALVIWSFALLLDKANALQSEADATI